MFNANIKNSIRYKFIKILGGVVLVSSGLLSLTLGIKEQRTLEHSLATKTQDMASYIAQLSVDPLIMQNVIILDFLVNQTHLDRDVLYAFILDARGNDVTSQYASINYQSPRIKSILAGLPGKIASREALAAIKKNEPLLEVSVPICTGNDVIGKVLVGITKVNIRRQIIQTMLFVACFNLGAALLAGVLIFFLSQKIIFNPIADLAAAASRLAKGDIANAISVRIATTGELQILVDSFKRMVGDLDKVTVSRGYMDSILEGMNNALFIASPQGKITRANAAANKLLGYEDGELLNQPLETIFAGVFPFQPYKIESHLAEGPMVSREMILLAKDGSRVAALFSVSTIRDGQGQVSDLICVVQDIRERIRMQEERQQLKDSLHRAEKLELLGTIAGKVAHDLNNVLGVLVGYSELLLENIPEGERTRDYAANILKSSEKGAAIIQDLLTLARRGVVSAEVVNLNKVVSDFFLTPVFEKIQDYHPLVFFRAELAPDLLNIKGSPVHIEKALMNLLANAAEAVSKIGKVLVRTENRYLDRPIGGYGEIKAGNYAVLTVLDDGDGISAAELEKIFEPFYTKKAMGRSGTGLGLSVVWGTVKDHGGYIDVHSEIGKGSAFTIYLPVTREELSEELSKVPPEEFMGQGESILVVDDALEQRELAVSMLTRLGYHAQAVASGEAAVDYLRDHAAELVMIDMIMEPGMDGLTTYEQILSLNTQQKAIIVSGFSETDRVRKARELGAGAYVKKPYVMEKIGLAIRAALSKTANISGKVS